MVDTSSIKLLNNWPPIDQYVLNINCLFKIYEKNIIVNDFINKVYFYEHEADKLEDQIKRKAFKTSEIRDLSRRVHIRHFAERISMLSDDAEAVCERLSIYSIKRSIWILTFKENR